MITSDLVRHKNNVIVSRGLFFFVITPVFVFANAISLYLHASSMRFGVTVGMSFILLVSLIVFRKQKIVVEKKFLSIIFILMSLILLQFAISFVYYDGVDTLRFLASYGLLFAIFITVVLFANILDITKEKYLHQLLYFSFWVLLIIGVVSSYTVPNHIVKDKFMLLFTEPSHFALVYLPLLLYVTYNNYIRKKSLSVLLYLTLSFLIAVSVGNSTLLVGLIMIIFLLYAHKKSSILFFLILFFIIGLIGGSSIDHFIARVMISTESRDVSVVVFMSGYERAYLSFIDSLGTGLGFQQMGIVGPKGIMMERLESLGTPNLNINDGGTLAAKLVAELGALGLFLLVTYLVVLYFVSRRILLKRVLNYKEMFFYSIFIMSSITLFVRGAGYFTPSVFMFIASIYWLLMKKKKVTVYGK